NSLIIQTEKGFFEYAHEKLQLSEINKILPPHSQVLLYGNSLQKEPLFVIEYDNQLFLFLLKNGSFQVVHKLANVPLSELLYLTEDKQGNIFFSTLKKGFSIIEKSGKTLNFNTSNGLPSANIHVIFKDSRDNIWLSSYGKGLIRYAGEDFVQFYTEAGFETGIVWAIQQDKNGKLWVAENAEKPLFFFNNGKFQALPVISEKYVRRGCGIAITPNNEVLMSSMRGLWQVQAGNLVEVTKKFGLPEDTYTNALRSTSKGLWIATYQNGVYFYDYQTKKTTWFNSQNINLVSDLVNDVFEDSEGKVWFCTNQGISVYDGKQMLNYDKKNKFHLDYVISVSEDKQKNLWFATFSGLVKFDRKSQNFEIYNEKIGISSTTIYSVLVDKRNWVWLGTQNGINIVQLDEKGNISKVKTYNQDNSFASLEANERAIYEDNEGNIWIGTVKGLIKCHPEAIRFDANIPIAHIIDLDLNLQKTNWLSEELQQYHQGLQNWEFVPKNLKLPYNLNYLSFHFETLTYSEENIFFQWKLEGIEEEWSRPSRKNEAIYTNLPPRNYRLLVRTCLPNGECSKKITTYVFTIEPAFWQTWWFVVLVVSFVIALIAFAIMQRIRAIETQKRILEEKVQQASQTLRLQNEALRKKNEEIEKQKSELQQLNATKDKFFSILAHDIKSPLNSLSAFLNIMTNHLDEMSRDDILFMSSNLNKSVKNLYGLLENVLSWSRSQMGVIEYKPQKINLYEMTEENLQLLAISAQSKGIELINLVEKDLYAFADANSLKAIFRNLLSNAIKFTSTDGKVIVSAKAEKDFVFVSVEDTGIGMNEYALSKIFDITARYSTKGTANESGTGLGLVLVKEFVEKNQGKIFVKSQEGVGTCFTFSLPALKDTEMQQTDCNTSIQIS
ncbi:MAG: ATP-binding protein, partial [Raineya sp.]|nr:ATP-binding protein [Raineya sp.]